MMICISFCQREVVEIASISYPTTQAVEVEQGKAKQAITEEYLQCGIFFNLFLSFLFLFLLVLIPHVDVCTTPIYKVQ